MAVRRGSTLSLSDASYRGSHVLKLYIVKVDLPTFWCAFVGGFSQHWSSALWQFSVYKQIFMCESPSRGGYSPKFRIGVCRERSQTLTLSKDKENEN